MLLLLTACGPGEGEATVEEVALSGWSYWVVVPADLPEAPVPALVHLHHSGNGEKMAASGENQAMLAEAGMIGIFPMGGGEPGDDWRVGRNKDDIPRDDRGFLADVARDVSERYGADGGVWLSGFSKGGAMVYDYACLGEEGLYAGFLPMAGAFEDWIFDDCTHGPAPVRHMQGSEDDRWPRHTADDPDSSHQGIVESLAGLAAADGGCMDAEPDHDGSCEVWSTCPTDVRLCTYDGGHSRPDGWIVSHREWIDLVSGR